MQHLYYLGPLSLSGQRCIQYKSLPRWQSNCSIPSDLSGQRCIKRSLLDDFDRWDTGFGLETALWSHLHRKGVKQPKIYWWSVSQVMKEKKRGLIRGFVGRLSMYKQIVCTCIKELQRH